MTVPNYALYVAGSDAPEALEAKRRYIAERRKAGLESMTGYAAPKVDRTGRDLTILLTPRQVEIMDLLDPSRSTKDIATEIGVTVETVRRQLRIMYQALGYTGWREMERELLAGNFTYRQKR